MRNYTFSHRMLSPIQQIIQAQHATVEMFNIYVWDESYDTRTPPTKDEYDCGWSLYNWSRKHKTHIACTAGGSKEIKELWEVILSDDNNYPFANFYEDEDSLESLMTSIAIVLPEKIYEMASLFKQRRIIKNTGGTYSTFNTHSFIWSKEEINEYSELMSQYGKFNDFEQWLVENLGNYPLVR